MKCECHDDRHKDIVSLKPMDGKEGVLPHDIQYEKSQRTLKRMLLMVTFIFEKLVFAQIQVIAHFKTDSHQDKLTHKNTFMVLDQDEEKAQ